MYDFMSEGIDPSKVEPKNQTFILDSWLIPRDDILTIFIKIKLFRENLKDFKNILYLPLY